MTDCRKLTGTALWLLALPWMVAPALAGGPAYTPDLVPPNPVAGECYVRVKIPAQYERTTKSVITRDAHTVPHIQPAQFETRNQVVEVKEASIRYEVRQPTYKTVAETIVTRPAYHKLSVTPPRFQTRTETLQTSAPRLVWKKGNPAALAAQGYVIHSTADGGLAGRGYTSTQHYGAQGGTKCGPMCEIWCLVEERGETVTVQRKVMAEPGRIHRQAVPARTETIHKQVVADPGGVRKIPVPAQYRSIAVDRLISQGREASVTVPAEYKNIQTRQLVSDERYEWRRVICNNRTVATTQSMTQPVMTHPIATRHNPPADLSKKRYQGTMTLPTRTYGQTHSHTQSHQPSIRYHYEGQTQIHATTPQTDLAGRHETGRFRANNYGATVPAYVPPQPQPASQGPARIRR